MEILPGLLILTFVATKLTTLPKNIYEYHAELANEIEEECRKDYKNLLEFLLMQRQVEEAEKSVAAAGKMKYDAEKNAECLKEKLQLLKSTLYQGSYSLNMRIRETTQQFQAANSAAAAAV